MHRVELVLFVAGISVLAYLYGFASTKKHWFPTPIVEDGWRAGKAWKQVWDDATRGLPYLAIRLVDEEPIHRRPSDVVPTQVSKSPDDLLLIIGGPFELMDFCPELGCLAWLMDRNGVVYHTWPIDPAVQWGKTLSGFQRADQIAPTDGHVYENGDIVMVFHGYNTFPFGAGVAKFDRNGQLLWKNELNAHHWLDVDDRGLIYVPAHRLLDSPVELGNTDHRLICEDKKIYEDLVVVLDADGRVIDEFSLLDVFIDSGYAGVLERTRSKCDPLHLNAVRPLKMKDEDAYPGFAAGDIVVSAHSVNAVAILDRDSRRIKWLTSGTMIAQHSPRFAGDNRILVLDNRAGTRIDGKGGSRIIGIDVASHRAETIFPKPDSSPSLDFYTSVAGYMDLDQAGSRALVSLYDQGRVIEVDLETGKVLWEYANVHDISRFLRSNGEDASTPYALFNINSADYASRPAFLK